MNFSLLFLKFGIDDSKRKKMFLPLINFENCSLLLFCKLLKKKKKTDFRQ